MKCYAEGWVGHTFNILKSLLANFQIDSMRSSVRQLADVSQKQLESLQNTVSLLRNLTETENQERSLRIQGCFA